MSDQSKAAKGQPGVSKGALKEASGVITAKTVRSSFTSAEVDAIRRELDELTAELD